MIYYTQLIFIRPGQQDTFHSFEEHVLPLLTRYNGVLVYRVRPEPQEVIATVLGHPYELHLVTFPTESDFEGYLDDQERLQCLHLKERSVERIMLVKGSLV